MRKVFLLLMFFSSPAHAQIVNFGTYYYDVTKYGAKCDGSTDDTLAIGKVLSTVVTRIQVLGSSAGPIDFPPRLHPCKFNGNVFAQNYVGSGITVLIENTLLLTGPITPSSWMQFICKPTASMGFIKNTPQFRPVGYLIAAGNNEVLNISGNIQQDYFEGCAFLASGPSSTTSPVHISSTPDNGGNAPTFLTFEGDAFNSNNAPVPAFKWTVAPNTGNGGYSASFTNSSFTCVQGIPACLQLDIAGILLFQRDLIFGAPVVFTNSGNVAGTTIFEDVNSENLTNQDFLILDTSGGGAIEGIKLIQVNLADTVGTVYMLKGIGTRNDDIEIDQVASGNWGMGILDPTTQPNGLSGVTCSGNGCGSIPGTPGFNITSFPSLMLRGIKPFISCDGTTNYKAIAFSDGQTWKCY